MAGKRRRLEIERIEDVNKRQVTFSKRRKGLFKKASELCILCGTHLVVIVFSPAGNPFVFGHPQADAVINHYLGRQSEPLPEPFRLGGGDDTEHSRFWWDSVDPERVNDAEELRSMVQAMEEARAKVLARAEELAAESKNDFVPASAAVDQRLLTVTGGDGHDGSCDALSLDNLDSLIAEPWEYDTVPAADADEGLRTMAGGDWHDGFFDGLSPLMNLDSYIASPSEYDTVPTAGADDGLPTMAGENGLDGVFDGLPPLMNLDSYIASPSEYDTVPTAGADDGLPTMAGENGLDGVFDGLPPLINLDSIAAPSEYDTVPSAAADDGHPTMSEGAGFDGLSPLNIHKYIAAPWSDWARLTEPCF